MSHEKPQTIEDVRALMNSLRTTLSHDLRTPLSTTNGWPFMLESDKLDAAGKKRALEKIRANIEMQVRLIDDVLLLSRSMTGHLQVNTAPISPLVPLAAAMENVRPYAVAGAVSMPPAKVTETATVLADAELLQRVFEIVLAHAITATPKGGAITTSAGVHDGKVEIPVADNGKGCPPE